MSKYVVTWPCGTQWQCDTLTEAKRMDALGKAQGKKRNPGGAKQRARGTRLADVSVYGGDPGEKFEHPDTKHLSGWYSPNDRYARLIKMAEKARASRGRALKSGEPGMNMSLHAHRAALAEARRLRATGKLKNGPLEQENAIALLRTIPVGHMRVVHGLMVHRPGQNLWDVAGAQGDLLISALRLRNGKTRNPTVTLPGSAAEVGEAFGRHSRKAARGVGSFFKSAHAAWKKNPGGAKQRARGTRLTGDWNNGYFTKGARHARSVEGAQKWRDVIGWYQESGHPDSKALIALAKQSHAGQLGLAKAYRPKLPNPSLPLSHASARKPPKDYLFLLVDPQGGWHSGWSYREDAADDFRENRAYYPVGTKIMARSTWDRLHKK